MKRAARWAARGRTSRRREDLAPEILEPVRRKLAVPDRVLNVLVTEIVLQGSGIVPVVCELESAAMPQHVRVNVEWHVATIADPAEQRIPALRRQRPATLGAKHERRCLLLAFQSP